MEKERIEAGDLFERGYKLAHGVTPDEAREKARDAERREELELLLLDFALARLESDGVVIADDFGGVRRFGIAAAIADIEAGRV